ncbi:MAG: hypothetical protein ACRDZO_24655 [Egibacteraceae bacterium]
MRRIQIHNDAALTEGSLLVAQRRTKDSSTEQQDCICGPAGPQMTAA